MTTLSKELRAVTFDPSSAPDSKALHFPEMTRFKQDDPIIVDSIKHPPQNAASLSNEIQPSRYDSHQSQGPSFSVYR
jgi:hypothetical protein